MPRQPKPYRGLLTPYLDEIKQLSVDGRTISEIADKINAKYRARIDYQHVRYVLYRMGGPINFDQRVEYTQRVRIATGKIRQFLAHLSPEERRAVMSNLFKG
jgi:hypothetical protein